MNEEKIEREVDLAVAESRDLEICDDDSLQAAGVFLRQIKTILKEIGDTFDEPIQAAHQAHKKMLAAKKKHTDPLLVAERTIKSGMSVYQAEQRRVAEAEERRLRDIARQEEEERRLAEAAELEAEGKGEEAEEVIDAPVETPPVVLQKATKVEGISTRKKWCWRLDDRSKIPPAYLIVDEKMVNKVVSAMGAECRIPGIMVFSEDVIAARAT
jgi:hypothetical protein